MAFRFEESYRQSEVCVAQQCCLYVSRSPLVARVKLILLSGIGTGHDPIHEPGQYLFNPSRVESGQVRRCSKPHGSGQAGLKGGCELLTVPGVRFETRKEAI